LKPSRARVNGVLRVEMKFQFTEGLNCTDSYLI
jgi:hypothetical protein